MGNWYYFFVHFMNKLLHFFTTIFVLGLVRGIKGCMSKNVTKRITYSSEFLKLEWDYAGKVVVQYGLVCAVAWNGERCAMWNEVDTW